METETWRNKKPKNGVNRNRKLQEAKTENWRKQKEKTGGNRN